MRKHKDQARSLAIKAAKEKAIALAKELGQVISRPHKVEEEPAGDLTPWGGRWNNNLATNTVQNVAGPSQSVSTIALGQIKVTAKVVVSFELE